MGNAALGKGDGNVAGILKEIKKKNENYFFILENKYNYPEINIENDFLYLKK